MKIFGYDLTIKFKWLSPPDPDDAIVPFNPSNLKLGKTPHRNDPRTLLFAKYVREDAPKAPDTCDYGVRINDFLMLLNDQLGDCVIAALLHILMIVRSMNGRDYTPSDATAESLYSSRAGYVRGRPETDAGANELDILKGWRKSPVEGCELLGYALVDHKNWEHVKLAHYLAGSLLMGVNLNRSAKTERIWTSTNDAPGSWDDSGYAGHAMCTVSYEDKRSDGICGFLKGLFNKAVLVAATWGGRQPIRPGWLAKYCEELWVPITSDWFDKNGIAPNMIYVDDLKAAIANAALQPIN